MKLALSIGGTPILAPSGVPTGGLEAGGSGQRIIQIGITILLVFIIIFALFSLVLGGIQWMTSEGDKQKLQNARNRVIFSIIGLAVAFLAFFIVNLVGGFFGVPLI